MSGKSKIGGEMTIQEAIKSGKPFYREAWGKSNLWSPSDKDGFQDMYAAFEGDGTRELSALTIADVLATDWKLFESSTKRQGGEE